jgi:hypothetical protein
MVIFCEMTVQISLGFNWPETFDCVKATSMERDVAYLGSIGSPVVPKWSVVASLLRSIRLKSHTSNCDEALDRRNAGACLCVQLFCAIGQGVDSLRESVEAISPPAC